MKLTDVSKKITKQDLCIFYVMSSWWAPYISWGWGQELAGSYYAWKTERRFKRYQNTLKTRKILGL